MRQRQITLENAGDSSHPGTPLELLFESFKRPFLGFRVDFNLAACKIAYVAGDAEPFGNFLRKVAVPDALHAAANKIVFRAHNRCGGLEASKMTYEN